MRRKIERTVRASDANLSSTSPLNLAETSDGVVLPVTAQPGARRNEVVGTHDGRLKIAVAQIAEKGRANAALIEVLADFLGLKRSQIRLQSGETSRQKTFLIQAVTISDLQMKLAQLGQK